MDLRTAILSNKSNIGYSYAIISAILFGSITTLAKPLLLTSINPITLSSFTYLIAGFFTLIIFALKERSNTSKPTKRDYGLLILIGLVGATLAPLAYFTGLQMTTASKTSILTNGEIIFTVALAILFFKERLRWIGYLGIMCSIAGILFLSIDFENQSIFELNIGDILIVCATLLWALDNNLSKIASKRIPSTLTIVMIKSLIGGSILFVLSRLYFDSIRLNFTDILPLLVLGVGGFGLSLFFFLKAMKLIGTLKSIIIFSSSSVFGLLFSVVFLNETIELSNMLVIALMVIGIFLVSKDEEKEI